MESPAENESGRKPKKRVVGHPLAARTKPFPTKKPESRSKPRKVKKPGSRTPGKTAGETPAQTLSEETAAETPGEASAQTLSEETAAETPGEASAQTLSEETAAETPGETSAQTSLQLAEQPAVAEVLVVRGLSKSFDDTVAVADINLTIAAGSFYGIVGPNGAGKTTTLSMITGLLRPDSGSVVVHGADVWTDPAKAKQQMGVLPDRLRLFDRLTGAQLLYYTAVLRGLDATTARSRAADLAAAFRIEDAMGRLVTDYSSGMTKKIALASAMIHSPRLLVLDEPFESVDPVSAATVTEILRGYVDAGGTVLLSSHSMDLVQRICDHVAIVVNGSILADGTIDEVRGDGSLEERFVELARGGRTVEELEWLHTFSN